MALPKWLEERRDSERVDRDSLIMKFAQVTPSEWQEANAQYLMEAGQVALSLGQRPTVAERLLERADREIQNPKGSQYETLMRDALTSLRESEPLECVRGWVTASVVAANGSHQKLDEITGEGALKLRDCGLGNIAEVLENYSAIRSQFGQQAANVCALGMLNQVDRWHLSRELEQSSAYERR